MRIERHADQSRTRKHELRIAGRPGSRYNPLDARERLDNMQCAAPIEGHTLRPPEPRVARRDFPGGSIRYSESCEDNVGPATYSASSGPNAR